jgi:prepilin-type N-terminal cleavage/methylation domain-containing protein
MPRLTPKMAFNKRMRQSGFTLIELLVVIAIIGLLSSVILASLNGARAKARDSRRIADMRQITTALEVFYNSNQAYPSTGGNWYSQCPGWGTLAANSVIPGLVPTYMPAFPSDPGMTLASNLNCYIYNSNATDYKLLDYNLSSDVNVGGYATLVDPSRNYGQTFQSSSQCAGATEATRTWAMWSPGGRCW